MKVAREIPHYYEDIVFHDHNLSLIDIFIESGRLSSTVNVGGVIYRLGDIVDDFWGSTAAPLALPFLNITLSSFTTLRWWRRDSLR